MVATWRVSPRFRIGLCGKTSRQPTVALFGAAICHVRAARPTGKRANRPVIARAVAGFSGFVLLRGDQPLPEGGELGRIRSRLGRGGIKAGIGRESALV